ncbi:MAG: rhodanese-like domain-containing protein [Bacillota bacterium]
MAVSNWQVSGPSPIIDSQELSERVRAGTAPRMIDVREPDEFAAGHIPGSENFPLSRFTAEFRKLTDKGEEIALICRSGNRSGMAQQFLRQQGYTRTRNLIGGMLDWYGPVE